jgi:hypothetical protein
MIKQRLLGAGFLRKWLLDHVPPEAYEFLGKVGNPAPTLSKDSSSVHWRI